MANRRPDELKYGYKKDYHLNPKLLKKSETIHPTENVPCIKEEYEDGWVIYRHPVKKTLMKGSQTWGRHKGQKPPPLDLVDVMGELIDVVTWEEIVSKLVNTAMSENDEVSLRAISELFNRAFGKPVSRSNVDITTKSDVEVAIKV